ncbi:MAG: TraM recognition domain-containing protein, partial [Nitrososphaerota archaeon]|nr:TraM recognition domain-containing protein [Nitrososphaerota archaeon]
ISPEDLEENQDVYVQISEDLLRHFPDFFTLLISQFITFFERRDEKKAKPILFLLDEFPRLGKIPPITGALATLRSKKITICILIQSLKQLEEIYGQTTSTVISDLCDFKFVLKATDPSTQEYFSSLVGTFEEIRLSESVNKHAFWGYTTGSGMSTSSVDSRIIKPAEFAALKDPILLHTIPNKDSKMDVTTFFVVQKHPYYLTA